MENESGNVVTVLYALPEEQVVVELEFETGMTAAEAVERSGLTERFGSIRKQDLVLGVYGVAVHSGYRLKPGDRVEISRPLQVDPRVMRRVLLDSGRVMGGAPAPDAGVRKKAGE